MKFYSILEGSQADINRRLLRLIRKTDTGEDVSSIKEELETLAEQIEALDERVKALEDSGETDSES